MTAHPARHVLHGLVLFVLGLVVLVAPASVASADDTSVAWSVSPADANGATDGRTRLELQLDPGATGTDRVIITNASTTEQTFAVYAADAFNTTDGGYDLLAAGQLSSGAGSWTSVDQPQVTIPALGSAAITVTVAVPAGATPGDHAAGVVVSRATPQTDGQGVTIDTRVAVRLAVRVSGELAPALTVQDVHVSYGASWVPFGPSDAVVTYEVENTGNVTVLGQPRIRVTGPFGVRLATTEPAATQEVLPGESFSVRTVVAGVAPALLDTAVVDVTMSAAPGPATELPLVSSSARTAFPAIPWTGLALLALLAGAAWWVLRIRRRRREEGEAMWAELVDHARAGELPARPGAGGAPAVQAFVLAAVLLAGALGAVLSSSAPAQAAVLPGAEPTLSLTVPAAPTTTPTVTETTATATATATAAATTTTTTTTTTTGGTAGSTTSGTRRSTASPSASDPAVESQVLADESTPTPTPTVLAADTVWHQTSGFTPMQRALVAVSGALLLGAAGLGVRALILARTARVAA